MTHPDTKLLNDIEAAKKMMLDEQANKGQLRGIIQFMQKVAKLRKAKRTMRHAKGGKAYATHWFTFLKDK